MSFDSLSYILLLCLSSILFNKADRKFRKYILLFASAFFYLAFSAKYFVLLLVLSLFTYFLAKKLNGRNRRSLLIVYLVIILTVLCFYKYYGLFSSFITTKNILFPLGISFYSFQLIAYFVDVYRKKLEPCTNISDFLLLVIFFPKIASGPIEDSSRFLEQTNKMNEASEQQIIEGFFLLLIGLFKKLMIANRIASLIDPVYKSYSQYSGSAIILSLILYAFEIYADFSGYSDMAIGSAKLFGIELSENFRHPYLCANFDDFWRRWHISLTGWFRNYVYFSLSGNRKGKLRTYLNIMIVFILSGIWHGNQFHYLIWGIINGVLVIISKILSEKKILNKNIRRALALILIVFSWTFFAAASTKDALGMLVRIFSAEGKFMKTGIDLSVAIILCLVLMISDIFDEKKDLLAVFKNKPFIVRALVYLFLIFITILFGYYGKMSSSSFIYFQF